MLLTNRFWRCLAFGITGAVIRAVDGGAQSSMRDRYLDLVPPAPLIVSQNPGTVRFMIYGDTTDSSYRDVAPADGIDDIRARRLHELADRFMPILRRSNFSFPRRFADFEASRTLHVDRWLNGRLATKDSIRLDHVARDSATDARLVALLHALGPRRVIRAMTHPRLRDETIAFLDFPGDDERTWRVAYDSAGARPHTYVHFFVDEFDEEEGGRSQYFIIQYWFFYPFNDATNNHEGDWEHINVRVTTRERFARDRQAGRGSPLSDTETRRIAGGVGAIPLDSLVIQGVDYYFHHSVVMVDYATADLRPALSPHATHETTHIWEDAGFTNYALRERMRVADARLATHPVGYIGGESRGPGELRRVIPTVRAAYDGNSHGTYPYPGLWVSVGQLATTEMLHGEVVPNTRLVPADAPWQHIIDDESYVVFGSGDFTLIPDWERLEPLVMSDPRSRAEWAWLLLPVRFGFPTSPSPGGGTLRRTNLGNASPEGPAFHPGWNVSGETIEHAPHVVSVLRGPAAPAGPWLALQPGWGVANVPLAMLGLMPGYGVAVATVVPYVVGVRRALGTPPTRVLFRGTLPPRVTSTGYGLLRERRYLNKARPQSVNGERLWFNLYFSDRLALENSFAWSSSKARYHVGGGEQFVDARVRYRQLTGGARVNFTGRETGVLQAFVRAGYGWTRHDIGTATFAGDTVSGTGYRDGFLPTVLPSQSWWPNTMYGGAGVEIFAPKRYWVLHRSGYGLRSDITLASARGSHRSIESSLAVVLGW